MQTKYGKLLAFTLLEILITLAIIGILSCIIYPTYNHHIIKVRRSIATTIMSDIAGRLEEFYMQKDNTYKGATIATLNVDNSSYKDYYQIDIPVATSTNYTIQATPIGNQAQADTKCGVLKLDQNGSKTNSGPGTIADCWFY